MSLSFDPRLPYIPNGTKIQVGGKEVEVLPKEHFVAYNEAIYARWREAMGEIETRIQLTERYLKQGPDVASATQIDVGNYGRVRVTGTTTIDLMKLRTNAARVTLHFTGGLTVTQGAAASGDYKPFMLSGSFSRVVDANDQLTLQYDSTDAMWFEVAFTAI